ncbi:PP2C family protein-serine/threonine phosphatase [Planctomycetota bacterium]
MTIRTRLLVLLLGTALVPLAIISLSHHIALRWARQRLTTNTRETLDSMAQRTLLQELGGYVEVLVREKQLVQALLQRQAREIEWALAQTSSTHEQPLSETTFGYDPNLQLSMEQYHPCFQDSNDPNVGALQIDYQRQTYAWMPRVENQNNKRLLTALASLTPIYHDLYQKTPDGTLWLMTRFDEGLTTRYPSAQVPPDARPFGQGRTPRTNRPDRNQRRGPQRSRQPRGFSNVQREPLFVDSVTGQMTVRVSAFINDPNGTRIGSTYLVRTIPEIFASLDLPDLWGQGVERMLIQVDPNETAPQTAQILLHDAQKAPVQAQRHRIQPGRLRSPDNTPFAAMVTDIAEGAAGVRTMRYKGKDYLWAYHPIDVQDVATLLMIPSDQVTALAQRMEKSLLRGSLTVLEISGLAFLVVVCIAVILAFRRARDVTQPISALIEAGQRLSHGDYEAQVQINTGDELEQLGEVFNQTGPKLREHQKMKYSLELARAVQQSLLPKQTPVLQNFDIAGQCLFCDETGGDCYDFIDLSDIAPDKHGIVLGDVSGHGIGAALLMAAIRGSLQSEAKHHSHDLTELMTELNKQIVRDTEVDRFVTLFYGVLDDPARSLVWAAAGHEPALWYHSATRKIEELPNTGMPIGVLDTAKYEQAGPIVLASQDILIIGTDGIREARNAQGNEFGRDRLYRVLRKNAHQSAEAVSATIIAAVLAFLGTAPRTDDITLVAIKTK